MARHDPDVVLMDLRMPELDGVEATRRIRADHADVNVLVLTTYDTDADILPAIEAGATGYLLKDAPREQLFSAIRAAARSETVLAPAVAAKLVHSVPRPDHEQLTGRELDVLRLVADGLTNRAIGRRLHVSEATVKTHLVHAYPKLGVDPRPWLLASPEEPARWIALDSLAAPPVDDAALAAARRAAVASDTVQDLVARLPPRGDGAGASGHESPGYLPNLLQLLADLGVRAGDLQAVDDAVDALETRQFDDGRLASFGRPSGTTHRPPGPGAHRGGPSVDQPGARLDLCPRPRGALAGAGTQG